MTLTKKDIFVVFSSVALFHSIFVYPFFGTGIGKIIQTAATAMMALYVISNVKSIFRRRYVFLNICLILLAVWLCISSVLSSGEVDGMDHTSLAGVLVSSASVVLCAFMVEVVSSNGLSHRLLQTFFYCAAFYVIVSLVNFFTADVDFGAGYFIGTKFQVSYMSIFLAALYYSLHWRNFSKFRIGFLLLVALSFCMCLVSQCKTGILGLAVFCLVIFSKKLWRVLSSPGVFVIVLLLCDSFLLLFQSVLEIPAISYFIEEVLEKDITLSSRTEIYYNAPFLILNRLWTGYGYGNSFSICEEYIGAPNCQNGILDCVLQTGVVGCLIMLLCFCAVLATAGRHRHFKGILAMLYMYIFISSVEITFDLPQLATALLLIMEPMKFNYEKKIDR